MANEAPASLRGLRVLIPRPQREQDPLVEMLRAQGCVVQVLPVIDIQPVESPELTARLQSELDRADMVIFISSNAVTCCLELLSRTGGVLPGRATYFAVGKSTAAQLANCGCQVSFPQDQANSEGLLELGSLRQIADKKILICRGEGGRDRLRDGLAERGAEVSYLDLYRRMPSQNFAAEINDLIGSGGIDIIIVHSGDIWTALYGCLEAANREKIRHLRLVVPGQRVAGLLVEQGVQNPVIAASALPDKMVEALVDCYTGIDLDKAGCDSN